MFQIAGTIGIATKMGYNFAFPEWKNYDNRDRFGFSEDIDNQKWFKNPLPICPVQNFREFPVKWGYHNVSPPDNVSLKGHFQSEKYFLHCKDTIKHYFEFKPIENDIRPNSIAVHLRCGDYGDNYHPICPTSYYSEALEYFPKDYTVYVFSDDPKKAREIIPGDYNYVEGNHTMKDLFLMTKCDNHIIANSTFSWWGAWLSGSDTVFAPRKWFGKEAKILSKEIYCEGWKII